MSFEESLALTATPALLWAFPLVFATLLALFLARVPHRRSLRRAALLAAFSGLAFAAAAALRPSGGAPASQLFRCSRGLAEFLLGVAAVNTTAIFLFDVVLPRLR